MILFNLKFFFLRALHQAKDDDRALVRNKKISFNLMCAAYQVLKSKSAARHFETEIVTLDVVGSDVGDVGHGRKQFLPMLQALEFVADQAIGLLFMTPLPNTDLPPHWWITADKSTPGGITNQVVLACPIVQGRRVAIFMGAPEVYDGREGRLQGGSLRDLAKYVTSMSYISHTSNKRCRNKPKLTELKHT